VSFRTRKFILKEDHLLFTVVNVDVKDEIEDGIAREVTRSCSLEFDLNPWGYSGYSVEQSSNGFG
jgi:hypothetical protein